MLSPEARRTTKARGVEWHELLDGYRVEFNADGNHSAVRVARVAGTNLKTFVEDCLGWARIVGAQVERFPPERHPDFPHLYCQSVAFLNPLGVAVARPPSFDFGALKLALEFRSLEYSVVDPSFIKFPLIYKTFTTRKETFDVYALPVQKGSFELQVGLARIPIPEPGPLLVAGGGVYYTVVGLPAVEDIYGNPFLPGNMRANIDKVVGRVNDDGFDGFAKHTLLCQAPELKPRRQADGAWAFDLTHHFARRGGAAGADVPTWNRLVRADGKWYEIFAKGSVTQQVYNEANFETAFLI